MSTALEDRKAEELVVGALLDAASPMLRSSPRALVDDSGIAPAEFVQPEMAAYVAATLALADAGRIATPEVVAVLTKGMPGVPADDFQRSQRLEHLRAANTLNRSNFRAVADQVHRLALLRKFKGHLEEQLRAVHERTANPTALTGATTNFLASLEHRIV